MAKVLIVDDEITMVQMVTELLRSEGHEVFPFSNFPQAIEGIETLQPELVISDLYLDKTRAHGLEILQKARALHPPAIVIIVTGFGSIQTALEAMKKTASEIAPSTRLRTVDSILRPLPAIVRTRPEVSLSEIGYPLF